MVMMELIQGDEEHLWQLARRDDGDDDGDDDGNSSTTTDSSSTPTPAPPSGPPPKPKPKPSPDTNTNTVTSSTSMIVVATSTSTTVKTSTSSPFSQTFSVTPFLTISSTSTTFSTLQLSSTQGQHGLASAAPIQSSATSTPSSAADGISDTSNDSTGFFIGIGVAIGASAAIILSALYFLYRHRRTRNRSISSTTQTHYHTHHHSDASVYSAQFTLAKGPITPVSPISTNTYPTPGPPVPSKSTVADPDEIPSSFHPDGLGKHPVVHGPPHPPLLFTPQSVFLKEQKVSTPVTVSTGILKPTNSNSNSKEQKKASAKTRATSAPIGVDVLKYERERELAAEVEKESMGKEWEIARKRGTGEGSVGAGSVESLPRWRDAVTWVRDQRARMLGRERL